MSAGLAARKLAERVSGRVLVLGIEEDMYFPLVVADELDRYPRLTVSYGSTTRSPAAAYDHPSYGIRDRVEFTVATDDKPRFVYNVGDSYDAIVIISSDTSSRDYVNRLTAALTRKTDQIIVMEARTLAEPLTGPEFGSYLPDDVSWLLKDLSDIPLEATLEDREEAVQNGMHYAEALPVEYQPSADYQQLFTDALASTKHDVARQVQAVAEQIDTARAGHPVLVSLARAGTPVGVLIKRYLRAAFGYDAPHYAVSIVRGRGIDSNALDYIAAHHDPADVIFIDGWTGKGAITRELTAALDTYTTDRGIRFPDDLAVLADTGSCTTIYGTRDDYLIPSAALNSTVSGLISRTVLNDDYIGPGDYHGAKFYTDLAAVDVSRQFIADVVALFTPDFIQSGVPVITDEADLVRVGGSRTALRPVRHRVRQPRQTRSRGNHPCPPPPRPMEDPHQRHRRRHRRPHSDARRRP